jgi:hypothetical protein
LSIASPMSSAYMEAIADVEARFPVDRWRAMGTELWPMLRVRWMFDDFAAAHAALRGEPPAVRSSLLRTLSGRISGRVGAYLDLWRDTWQYRAGRDRGPTRRDLLMLSDGVSFARLGVEWLERFCDPIIARASRRGLSSLLLMPLYGVRRPRATPARFVQPGIDVATALGISFARVDDAQIELPEHAAVIESLRRRGFRVASLERSAIARDATRLQAVTSYYRRLLSRVRPKLAFIVSYYSLDGFAFVRACHQLQIRVVELQHGAQGDLHPAYAAWPRPASGKFDLLPDVFWVWSTSEADVINTWARGTRHRALAAGNPWLDVWRAESPWPVAHARAAAAALKERVAGRSVALITLQFGLAPSAQLEPMAKLVSSAGSDLVFWVRLHPMMLSEREAVRKLLGDSRRFVLDESSDLPMHALLPFVDVHVTHSSSSIIEAAQYGITSVITSAYGAELYREFTDSGMAVVDVGDVGPLRETVLRSAKRRAPPLDGAMGGDIDRALDELLLETQA